MITTVISGGQNGADQGGVAAAKKLGIKTGGFVPNGWITLDGPAPHLEKEYGMQQHKSPKYPPRTEANVKMADGTIRFATNFNSYGEQCTLKAIKKHSKPYFDVDVRNPPDVAEVVKWITSNNIKILNVAGNSEKSSPGIFDFVMNYMLMVLDA